MKIILELENVENTEQNIEALERILNKDIARCNDDVYILDTLSILRSIIKIRDGKTINDK